MQQLQKSSDPLACASAVIEAALDVLLVMREQTARHHGKNAATLVHVRAMGILRKRPGSTLSALAAQLALTLSATSRLVDALVAKGLVARSTPAANRRTLALHLTPVGARAHARAYNHAQHELALLLQRLPLNTRTTLTRSMHALRQALQPAA